MRLLLFVGLVLGACGHPHYSLSAPSPSAPPAERMQAFYRLHASAVGEQTTCSNRGGCSSTQYLVLADGTEIWHPEDLAPVVAPQSEAGASMNRLLQLQERARFWRKVMLIPMGVGIAFAVCDRR